MWYDVTLIREATGAVSHTFSIEADNQREAENLAEANCDSINKWDDKSNLVMDVVQIL